MSVLPRDLLQRAFPDNPRLRSAFEELDTYLSAALGNIDTLSSSATDADTRLVTLEGQNNQPASDLLTAIAASDPSLTGAVEVVSTNVTSVRGIDTTDDACLVSRSNLMSYAGKGVTASRPPLSAKRRGIYFDTSFAPNGQPMFWTGTAWVDANGGSGGGSTSVAWGAITGTLSAQTDLQTALNAKANTSSLGYFATGTNASNLTGTVAAAQMPALTGDATTTAGSTAVTVTQASGAFSVNGGTLTVKSGGGLKMWDTTNTTSVKFTFSGTTVTINQPVSITGNITATNLSGTNTGDETSATILSKLGVSAIASGTYTPTATNATNLTANTLYACQYMRVGNTVTVSGRIDLQPTATATQTRIDLTLPVSTNNFTLSQQSGGAATSITAAQTLGIFAVTSSQTVRLQGISNGTTNTAHTFSFTYQVV